MCVNSTVSYSTVILRLFGIRIVHFTFQAASAYPTMGHELLTLTPASGRQASPQSWDIT